MNTSADSPVIAVTGATGFIGRALTVQLITAGYRVRALVRSPARAARLAKLEVELVQGNLDDATRLRSLTAGVQGVVHCAGAVRGVTQAQFDRVNVQGVRNILTAAREQEHPPRFLSLSSLAAREPGLSAYANSKRRGEDLLSTETGEMPWIALRPPAVYGPGDKELLPLFRTMARGYAPIPGRDDARFSVIYVDDLARSAVEWLQQEIPATGVFELHDGHEGGYQWDDVIRYIRMLTSRPVKKFHVPKWLLEIPAGFNWVAGRILPYAPMLTPGKIRELTHPNWVCSNGEIHRALGWEPRVQLDEGLKRTPGWRS